MANYTLKNLKRDVEDSAPKFGLSPSLEGRFATAALECEKTGISYQRYAPNFRAPFAHKHREQEEIYVVVRGGGRMKLEDDIVELKQWDALRVTGETIRNFEAGPEGAEMLVFGAPRMQPSDGELKHGWWTD